MLDVLVKVEPGLKPYLFNKKDGNQSINFGEPDAVRLLNKALLKSDYKIDFWDIPPGHLCPGVPGRADYIHYTADFLKGKFKSIKGLKCLDIGTGPSVIYPLIGHRIHNWSFIATEVDEVSLRSAKGIVTANGLKAKIDLRGQSDRKQLIKNLLSPDEKIDLVICNPPFYSSIEEAMENSQRKISNLKLRPKDKSTFDGTKSELTYPGGELAFVKLLIEETSQLKSQIKWASSLISKNDHLPNLIKFLEFKKVKEHSILNMHLGNKKLRILIWRY